MQALKQFSDQVLETTSAEPRLVANEFQFGQCHYLFDLYAGIM